MVENSYIIYSLRSIRIRTKTGGFGTSPKKINFCRNSCRTCHPASNEQAGEYSFENKPRNACYTKLLLMLLEKELNRNECFKVRIPHTYFHSIHRQHFLHDFHSTTITTYSKRRRSLSFIRRHIPQLSVLLFIRRSSFIRYDVITDNHSVSRWRIHAYPIRLHLAGNGVGARNIDTHTRCGLLFSLLAQERLLSSHLSPPIPSLSSTFRAACND